MKRTELNHLSYEVNNDNMQHEMRKYEIRKTTLCTNALEFIFVLWIHLQS